MQHWPAFRERVGAVAQYTKPPWLRKMCFATVQRCWRRGWDEKWTVWGRCGKPLAQTAN